MASLKNRKNSPFYSIQFKDKNGNWKTTRTKYRKGIPQDDKQALTHCAYQTASELAAKAADPSQKMGCLGSAIICDAHSQSGYPKWVLAVMELALPLLE